MTPLPDRCEIYIANNFASYGIDASIEDDCARLYHVGCNETWTSNTDHQHIGTACDSGEIGRVGVANSHGGILTHQHECARLTANVAASNNHGIKASDRQSGVTQHGQNHIGSRGYETGKAKQKIPRVTRSKPIHVLFRL